MQSCRNEQTNCMLTFAILPLFLAHSLQPNADPLLFAAPFAAPSLLPEQHPCYAIFADETQCACKDALQQHMQHTMTLCWQTLLCSWQWLQTINEQVQA